VVHNRLFSVKIAVLKFVFQRWQTGFLNNLIKYPIMNKKLLGTLIVTVIIISMTMTSVMADIPGSLTVVEASSDGTTHVMKVQDKVKQIPAGKADDIITFWAWAIPPLSDAPEGTVLVVDAITIHHGVNDHQAFGKAAQSSPVQSFHPHKAFFDENGCIIGLQSPKSPFSVKDNVLTLKASDTAVAVATGTIGAVEGCPVGLGITGVVTPPTALPIP